MSATRSSASRSSVFPFPQEFVEKDWDAAAMEQEDGTLFEEDWDDTEVDDNDFCNQLRAELARNNTTQ